MTVRGAGGGSAGVARRAGGVSRIVVALLVATLVGCASPAERNGSPPPVDPVPGADASGLRIVAETYRSRFDAASGGIQVAVTNESDVPIVVTGTRVESEALTAAATSTRHVEIPAGATRDVSVALPPPACAAAPSLDSVSVVLDVQVDATGATSGGEGGGPRDTPSASPLPVSLRAPDRLGQFAEWWEAACLAEAVAARAELAVLLVDNPPAGGGDARDSGGGGGAGTGVIALELVARPLAGDPATRPLRLEGIASTILLGLLDPAGERVTTLPLDVAVDPGSRSPTVVRLAAEPARCDPHAIAEDKQGTLFRVLVAVDDRRGSVTVAAAPETRERIYAAITRACADPRAADD